MKNTILIPALEPSEDLIVYVKELLHEGISSIVIVDDGSSEKAQNIFKEINTFNKCTVLTHTENMGKGTALKTAILYIRDNMPHCDGIITADADGQHSIKDVLKVNEALATNPDKLILGVREFDKNTPARSLLGNKVSAKTLKFLYGINLEDTQTGLRGIARKHFDWLLSLNGERYEYEINMLIYSKKAHLNIHTVPIQTLYFDNNSASHFKAVKDGLKVYGKMLTGLFQYVGSSCFSSLVDVMLFTILLYTSNFFLSATTAIAISTFIARALSSLLNFKLNHHIFTGEIVSSMKIYIKYYTLWTIQLLTSVLLVTTITSSFGFSNITAKILVDCFLGIFSYQVQLHWVFREAYSDKLFVSQKKLIKRIIGKTQRYSTTIVNQAKLELKHII